MTGVMGMSAASAFADGRRGRELRIHEMLREFDQNTAAFMAKVPLKTDAQGRELPRAAPNPALK